MSTATVTKVQTAAKSTKAVKATKAPSTPEVTDLRAFILNEERAVPVVTTISLPYVVRDTLWDYKEANGFASYGEAIQALLAEQGYQF